MLSDNRVRATFIELPTKSTISTLLLVLSTLLFDKKLVAAMTDPNFFIFPDEILGKNENPVFGHDMLKFFDFEPGYVNVNHGSYGSLPKVINQCRRYWQDRAERCPDRFYRYELFPLLDKSIREVAKLINVKDAEDLAFIPNASAGMNAIMRSIHFNESDIVLYLSEAYGAVKMTAQYSANFGAATYHEIPVKYPFTEKELVEEIEKEIIKLNSRVKMLSVSHISSVPTAIFPVNQLIHICRKHKVYIVIDGAHTLGQIPLDIEKMDPDFYVTNGHKWLYTPRGSAVLYVKKSLQPLIHPTVISWNYKLGFQREFHQLGTLDYSNLLTFPTAMEFRRRLGGENKIMHYCHNTVIEGARKLAKIWGTDWSLAPEHQLGAMANVRMPVNDSLLINSVVEKLFLSHRTFLANFQEDNVWYARISAQIFNEPEDFEKVGLDFLDILKFVRSQIPIVFNVSQSTCHCEKVEKANCSNNETTIED